MFGLYLLLLLLVPSLISAAPEKKRALIWVANPNNVTRNLAMIADLKTHRSGFTGLAYQFFAICGEGSDDKGGSNDCSRADATGAPHLVAGHPTGVPADLGKQLRDALGPELELWPVISYGNPGNASVLNRLLNDAEVTAAFVEDAVRTAHAQNLTGYNIDIECQGMGNISGFLEVFAAGLHAATPRIGLSYDAGNTPTGTAQLDRWISMATYTADLSAFKAGLTQGLKASGSRFGVGLCPSCGGASSVSAVQERFDAIASIGQGQVRELDLWAYGEGAPWANYWPHLTAWLAQP